MSPRPFPNGVYCPLTTPFKAQTEEVDYDALKTQVVRLAKARCGIVLLGTNGEASHLSDTERTSIITAARTALTAANFPDTALLVGTGTGSARETVKLCNEAKAAGADYAIVIPPGYFAFAIGKNREALKSYFWEVLDKSEVPVMIYNFPGASAGIDLDSDILVELSEHQNCFGAKLTCGGIGKGHRLSIHTQSAEYKKRHPTPFIVMPGFSDILLPSMIALSSGCITGTGNIIPKTIVKLYDVAEEALRTGSLEKLREAQALQEIVSLADWAIVKAGIGGTKYALDTYVQAGLGGVPRSPLPIAGQEIHALLARDLVRAVEFEKSLP
ncbi:putative dihydrodipicolinate synthase [Pterulicium gracile]|uniref:Putative dihydrodipicolinate synthase n=1 Tax=Pterulicium gracile TaxID=1884261 RepID=A0A5C3QU94_9AGAR|nr:putative dihydrodipicolinate synthase [Pterula gracilis]